MPKNKILKISFLLCLFFLLARADAVLALEINYPSVPGALPPQEFVGIAPSEQIVSLYALYIFNLAIWLAGAIALGVLIYAGILYLTSAGKPERMTRAREQITASFFGILLLLSSYIILQILNPQLVIFETPIFEPVETIERPELPEPPAELHRSAIGAEVPFANIIEDRIFATSTMARIKENASTTLDIANELAERDKEIKDETEKCRCYKNTVPYPDPHCPDCQSERCTSDTCDPQRVEIERLQQEEVLPLLEKLKAERQKTVEEVRLLKEELGKLERAEQFMIDCQLTPLESLAEFLNSKNFYQANKWLFLDIKFWEQILTVEDWANFYCPVSGTIWGRVQYTPPEEATSAESSEQTLEPLACLTEVPVGDVIDRAKRTAKLLIEKLEKLIDLQGEMIEAVNQMLVLTSQYSSDNCFPVTYAIRDHTGSCVGCVIVGCFGLPGPYSEIQCQVKTIEIIRDRIERLVMGAGEEEIEEMPFCGNVSDLPLAQKRSFYNSCKAEYGDITSVMREGWIEYAQNNLECTFDKFTTICEWKGSAEGLRDYVANYVRAQVDEDMLGNFSGYWCTLPDKKIELSRINEYIDCVDGGTEESIEFCYDALEDRYDSEDRLPCVDTCVANKIKKELGEYESTLTEEEEELGIIPLIEQKVPPILRDLEKEVRLQMKLCVTEISPERPEDLPAVLLSNCEAAIRAIGPKGIIIENCCLEEPQFRECQAECYLQEGQENYKACLGSCLRNKSEELRAEGKIRESEIIATCRNRINFYCCGG